MAKSWKTWIATGSASLGVLFSYVQFSGPDEDTQARPANNTPTLHGSISNPFGTSASADIVEEENPAPLATKVANTVSAEAIPLDEKTEKMRKDAHFFLEALRAANTPMKKFDALTSILDCLGGDIKNAKLIGLVPAEFARRVRDTSYQILPELQAQQPQTDLEKIIRLNLIRIAIVNISLMDDGSYNQEYAAQMSGVDAHKNNNDKISLAYTAGAEAVTALRAAPDPKNMSHEQLTHYLSLVNIVLYVETSLELWEKNVDRIDRLGKIGLDIDKLAELETKITRPMIAEIQRRIDESATPAPAQNTGPHPMLPRTPS